MPHQLVEWASFLKKIRAFFDERGFLEVTTPHLVEAGAFEGVIDTFRVEGKHSSFELHSSPEIEMKAALAQTQRSIYQICQSFRDDPDSLIHLKEFTMLEFYRVGASYQETMKDTQELISKAANRPLSFEKDSIANWVEKYTGIHLAENLDRATFVKTLESTKRVSPHPHDSWNDLFFKLWIDHVESKFPKDTPVIVYDYPPEQSALGKIGENGWVERFEIYWKGMELCNGCTELGDSTQLKARYEIESAIRASRNLSSHPFPNRLLEATKNLPASSGVAVGLNRLFWALER